jgi:hypothetical protein
MTALLLALALVDAPAPPAPALTNEDVVKMVAAGTSERTIVETIETRSEAFDLSEEMVDELRLAGVSETILTAMRHRHAETSPPPAPSPPPDRPKRGHVPLVVTLNAGAARGRTLHAPAWADEDAKRRLQLPKENDQRTVRDLAVFLACTSAEHIPDLWRSKSPLGRDMVAVPRHEMLAFVVGDTPSGKEPRLTLPERLEANVDGAETHDLLLGVAALIGDRWLMVSAARLAKVDVVAGGKPLAGKIARGAAALDFKIELTAPR